MTCAGWGRESAGQKAWQADSLTADTWRAGYQTAIDTLNRLPGPLLATFIPRLLTVADDPAFSAGFRQAMHDTIERKPRMNTQIQTLADHLGITPTITTDEDSTVAVWSTQIVRAAARDRLTVDVLTEHTEQEPPHAFVYMSGDLTATADQLDAIATAMKTAHTLLERITAWL